MLPLFLYLTMNGPPVDYSKAIQSVRQLADATKVAQDLAISRRMTVPPKQQATANRYGVGGFIDTLTNLAGGSPDDLKLTPTTNPDLVGAMETEHFAATGKNEIRGYIQDPGTSLSGEGRTRGSLAHEYGHLFNILQENPIMKEFVKRSDVQTYTESDSAEEAFADMFSQAVGRKAANVHGYPYDFTGKYENPSTTALLDSLVGTRLRSMAKLPFLR